MASLISYFTKNEALSAKEGLEVYEFTGNAEEFVKECVDRFRKAYVSDEKINKILSSSKTSTRNDIIGRRLPTEIRNKAGDFGEILSFYLWTETWATDANILPMKWRWKEHPDMPSHLVDVILLKRVDPDNASTEDKMYTVESKVWTSRVPGDHSSLTQALEDAVTDDVERAAKAIPYLVLQYERDEEYDLSEQVKRFGDPVDVSYQKKHCAIAIVESEQIDLHLGNFDRSLHKVHKHIPVYYLPVSGLRQIYLDLYNEIPNS